MREYEKELFDELLKVIAERKNDFPETKDQTKLTAFSAVQGPNYSKDMGLMVVGRAVDQWAIGWLPGKVASPEGRKEIIDDVYKQGKDKKLFDLDLWGDEDKEQYNTHESAFWRVAKLVTEKLHIVNGRKIWRDHLIYSNLYKISPAAGGNPSDKLCLAQEESCSNLLKEELTQWAPKWVLFLTGMNWAETFIKYLGITGHDNAGLVKFSGKLSILQSNSISNIVVADHPRNKLKGTTEEDLTNAISDVFSELEKIT